MVHVMLADSSRPMPNTHHPLAPPTPGLQANRRQWAPLVQHCRTHGGDRAYERTGASLRHGLGVPFEQHEAYLASIGLEPETTAAGWVAGWVETDCNLVSGVPCSAAPPCPAPHLTNWQRARPKLSVSSPLPVRRLQGLGGRGGRLGAAAAGPAARLQHVLPQGGRMAGG